MSGIILQNPLGKGLLIMAAHAGGALALANQQIAASRAAFPEPLANAQGRTAMIIGSTSFGYGSATAMALRAAGFERILGLGFETPPVVSPEKVSRASTGWYLTGALHEAGVVDRTYLADAFSDATRERVIADMIARNERLDLLVYSLAAPSRTHGGQKWTSALKVIGNALNVTALDYDMLRFKGAQLKAKVVEAATDEEIDSTVRVMGGDDLQLWVGALLAAGRLKEGAVVTARSYIGPEGLMELRRLYWDGTIGAAKKHIDTTTRGLNARLQSEIGGRAFSEVDPAVVTVASAAIPAIAKYLASYLAVADGGAGIYNDPLGVSIKLARTLYGNGEPWKDLLDSEGRLRLDGDEMQPALQEAIRAVWDANSSPGEPTVDLLRGLDGYRERYLQLFGFGVPGVDYAQAYEFNRPLTSEMGVHDLISKPKGESPAPSPAVIESTKPTRGDETRKISAVDSFFNALLSRENEQGVSKVPEGDKTVFVSEHTFNPDQIRSYADVTGQPQDGTVPAAFTFVIAFSNILDTVKDILNVAQKKSVVHAAEEIALPHGAIRAEGTVKVRTWLANEKGKRGEGPVMAFVNREVIGSDGALLGTGRTTLLIGQDLSQLPAVAAKAADLEGELLSTMTMTQDWINRYSGASGDANPIHMSEEAARELGLSSTIAHGVLTLGLSNRDHLASYKASWKTPVVPGDVVEFRRSGKKIVGIKTAPDGQKFLAIELMPK